MTYSFERKDGNVIEFDYNKSISLSSQVVLINTVCDSVLHFGGSECSTNRYLTDYFLFQAVVKFYTAIDLDTFDEDDTYELYKEFNNILMYTLIDMNEFNFIKNAINSKLDYEYQIVINKSKIDALLESAIRYMNTASEKLEFVDKDSIVNVLNVVDKLKDVSTITDLFKAQQDNKNE